MKRGSLFQNVRGLLQSMTLSETEQGRRVQTTLIGLPTFMRDRILGDNPNRSDEDDNTTSLHDKLVNEMEKKPTKAAASKIDILQTEDKADGIRAKYLDKNNAIKQRAKAKSTSLALGVIPPTSAQRQAEFEHFVTDVCISVVSWSNNIFSSSLDAIMDSADLAAFPQPTPIHNVCKLLDLEPKDIVVRASDRVLHLKT
ncbi:hypothetical protein AC1031_021002 [Aphanomyces cochlioides]|nr:hypothetical protein AC1031_021002 [Aphanomyces cochlioides]